MNNDSRERIFQEENTNYTTKYKVIDLVKDKYDMSFTNYDNALEYCDRCLKDGATELGLITTLTLFSPGKI